MTIERINKIVITNPLNGMTFTVEKNDMGWTIAILRPARGHGPGETLEKEIRMFITDDDAVELAKELGTK